MKSDKMDDMLKAYFSGHKHTPERSVDCPSVDILSDYASGIIEPAELYTISSHIKNCSFCTELVEGALLYSAYGKHIKLENIPEKVRNSAKSLHPAYKSKEQKKMRYLKTNSWIILSLASLAASFFFKPYFLQFLILTVLFGLKWIFNKESTRTLIMIYNAWKKHDKDSDKNLEEIFRNRLS